MGAQEEKAFADAPKTLYRMWLLDVDFVHPFEFSHRPATFTTSFHGQYTKDSKLSLSEYQPQSRINQAFSA